jgi:tetratricopeptide (TPR) repeat protein
MSKRFKTIKEVDLEEPRSAKGARCATMQSVVQRPKLHVGEMIICGLLILLLMTGTYWRNRVWSSEVELWTDCVKKPPHKDRPHNNLGRAFLDQGRSQEAISHLNEALRINPEFSEVHYNLGNVFSNQGKYQEATSIYG